MHQPLLADLILVQVRLIDTQPGQGLRSRKWDFDVPKITLRELVRQRVRRDVEAFNSKRPEVYHGLVQPEESERLLNGYQLKRLRQLDPDREIEHAIEAFGSNGFRVFVEGRQIGSLDEEIDLETAGEVEFLKLVPLA